MKSRIVHIIQELEISLYDFRPQSCERRGRYVYLRGH